MTGSEIITMAEDLVDEDIAETIALHLINNKINEIEAERDWNYLKTTSATLTALSTDTYLTAKTIPTDCDVILKLEVGTQEYKPRGIEEINSKKDIAGYYFIKGSSFYLSGTISETKTITITYKKISTEITAATAPNIPTRFQKMLSFFLAADFYIMDAGEKNMSWQRELEVKGEKLLNQMRLWNSKTSADAMNTEQAELSNITEDTNQFNPYIIN